MEFEEIVQNFIDGIYKGCATQPIVKFNSAIAYDTNHTLYEYYVYFREEVYDIIDLLWNIREQKVEDIWNIREQKVESINSLRGGY